MADEHSQRQGAWDRFIDDLDRAGQAGSAADVTVPPLAPEEYGRGGGGGVGFMDVGVGAGRAGGAADVPVPPLAPDLPSGIRFADLTRVDLENLSRLASKLGRRADVVTVLWQDMERRR